MKEKDNYFISGVGSALIVTPFLIAMLDAMFPQNELFHAVGVVVIGIITYTYALRTNDENQE